MFSIRPVNDWERSQSPGPLAEAWAEEWAEGGRWGTVHHGGS